MRKKEKKGAKDIQINEQQTKIEHQHRTKTHTHTEIYPCDMILYTT